MNTRQNNMDIKERQQKIVSDILAIGDWSGKYEYIIDFGKDIPLIDEKNRSDDNLIKGCQSCAWLLGEKEENGLRFSGDSNSLIVKGLVAMLIYVFNKETSQNILTAEVFFMTETGLAKHLSNRSSGVTAMFKRINHFAMLYDKP